MLVLLLVLLLLLLLLLVLLLLVLVLMLVLLLVVVAVVAGTVFASAIMTNVMDVFAATTIIEKRKFLYYLYILLILLILAVGVASLLPLIAQVLEIELASRNRESSIIILIFLALVPLLNALSDWLSVRATRRFMAYSPESSSLRFYQAHLERHSCCRLLNLQLVGGHTFGIA